MKLISHIISALFHPYLIPFYGCIIFITNSYLIALPTIISLYFIATIFFFTCLLPVVSHMMLKIMNKKENNNEIILRVELLLNSILLILCSIFMHRIHAPIWTQAYLVGASLATTTVWVCRMCNYSISAHMAALGALWGLIFIIPQTQSPIALEIIIILILATGITGTTRQILDKENIIQLFWGLLCGLIFPIISQKILSLSLFSTL